MMPMRVARWAGGGILAFLMMALPVTTLRAQSGSAGGSIGNDDKAISGSRSEPRAVERERPSPRRSSSETPRARPSGGANSFDGAWVVTNIGGAACPGTLSSAVVVTSGKIIAQGVTSGTVSPSGAVNSSGSDNGVRFTTSGRASGRTASGTFRRSDGCSGTWTGVKQ